MSAYNPTTPELAPMVDDKEREALLKIAALLYGALSGTAPLRVTFPAGSIKTAQYSYDLAQNTQGGSSVAGSWQTYPINTEVKDTDGIGSLASNKITLGAGHYRINAAIFFNGSGATQARIYNVTDSTVAGFGPVSIISAISQDSAEVFAEFTITATKEVRVEYQIQSAVANFGLGYPGNYGTERYASVVIEKLP